MRQANADSTTNRTTIDPAALRARIAVAVEKLIAALDALDAATEDREDDDDGGPGDEDDEPSLGWYGITASWRPVHFGQVDLESEHDGREDDDPGEHDGTEADPWLGAFERMMNQEKSWRQREQGLWGGCYVDCEQDNADREDADPAEDGGDAEYSLGWQL